MPAKIHSMEGKSEVSQNICMMRELELGVLFTDHGTK